MKRNVLLYLVDILESIEAIEEFSKKLKRSSLDADRLRKSAITREIEIIGEAAKNLPPSIIKEYPEVRWKEIAGSRDRITHAYFRVDSDIIWAIIKEHIPILKKQIKKIRKDIEKKK